MKSRNVVIGVGRIGSKEEVANLWKRKERAHDDKKRGQTDEPNPRKTLSKYPTFYGFMEYLSVSFKCMVKLRRASDLFDANTPSLRGTSAC